MDIKFKKLSDKAVEPIRTADSGAGYNLTTAGVSTEANERGQIILVYHSGIGIDIPEGYEASIRPSNTICSKTLRMCNEGTVAGNYEEVVGKFVVTTDVIPAVYNDGDIFAQLIINKIEETEFVEFIDTTKDEQSAPETPESLPETKDESINSEDVAKGSGEAQSGLEQA